MLKLGYEQIKFSEKQKSNWKPLIKSNVKYIIIHHTASESASIDDIMKWHTDKNYTGGFGYNAYIQKNGKQWIGRGENVGAHCYNYNSISFGLCLEGNYTKNKYPENAQLISAFDCIYKLRKYYGNIEIAPHSKYYKTDCPSFDFNKFLEQYYFSEKIYKLVERGIIKSSEYWINSKLDGISYNKDYVDILINRI